MSVTTNIFGGLEISDPVHLSTDETIDIYVATDKDSIVASLSIANDGANVATVTLIRNDGVTENVIWHQIIAAQSTDIIKDIPIRLYDGEKICAKAKQAGSTQPISVTITPIVIRTGSYEAKISSNS